MYKKALSINGYIVSAYL